MRTSEQTWGRAAFEQDAAPELLPLDGDRVLARGRARRRRQRTLAAAPLAAASALVLGTGLWAGDMLPGPVQSALPAAPGAVPDCPTLHPRPGGPEHGPEGTRAADVVDGDTSHLSVLAWTTADGTEVSVLRTQGCTPFAGRWGGIGLDVVMHDPEGVTLHGGTRVPAEDVTTWGATILPVPGTSNAVAIVPPRTESLSVVGQGSAGPLQDLLGEQGQVIARIARVSGTGPDGTGVVALLWTSSDHPDRWTSSWLADDLLAVEGQERPERSGAADPQLGPPPSVGSRVPHLARSEGDGSWWLWLGGSTAAGPVQAPGGAWVARLSDDGRGTFWSGWIPDGSVELLVDGQSTRPMPMSTVVGTAPEGLRPFAVETDTVTDSLVAVGPDGEQTPVRVVEVPVQEGLVD